MWDPGKGNQRLLYYSSYFILFSIDSLLELKALLVWYFNRSQPWGVQALGLFSIAESRRKIHPNQTTTNSTAFIQNPSPVSKTKRLLPDLGTDPVGCTLDLCEICLTPLLVLLTQSNGSGSLGNTV